MSSTQVHSSTQQAQYQAIDTPFLYVNKPVFINNLNQLRNKIEGLGANLRPHFKTLRSLEAAELLLPSKDSPVTVSTVKEAEALASAGYKDIVYAVGIADTKLPRIASMLTQGINVRVLLDSIEQAHQLNNFCETHGCSISALIELDCDGHRGGIAPEDDKLLEIAELLTDGAASFNGVLTHAGESYQCFDKQQLIDAAQNEVAAAVKAAERIRAANMVCDIVSIGSTPTAQSYQNLEGITEVRAGVYTFFDLVMAGLNVCQLSDIAASVVTSVIGHNADKNWIFVDAGWMALSGDRGTAEQPKDCGYGLVCDENGQVLSGLQVITVNQEHGIIQAVDGSPICLEEFPVGSRLHILPNHACATASMHAQYHVFDTDNDDYEIWNRVQGW
ncbi:DSD1 family PLP-dependent enzyme [Shewanella fidelis]|uniref:DSD1 family PLP-dependent enzyme n=1 Tax=Shewanella fidelis TaxID=173509 RepID=A0AAW8NKH6_9GAMM|nr:DSD1 family PLP-dependent enzyme [Shewanella fidelis]MDR8523041.1 DSD1 family PLP-dependent enzyme [Shewanella fidelis]MDW4811633.1 DSD1 family PLP-dependent enzyme [Shewanella fidelis]MDW4815754.1 DSD1 family PLP-dependent enzyme [Shewanella fidelis]MDW4819844.1 DSD1 family PLP-dependent enzyme [Shewanella fidelis]MDW4824182.1 DSD1 family PLP-dependent enzyme [Shewanella fidelis]